MSRVSGSCIWNTHQLVSYVSYSVENNTVVVVCCVFQFSWYCTTLREFDINWLLAYDTCSWFPVVLQLSSIKRAKSSMTFIAGEFQFCTRPSILCFDLHKDIRFHFSKSHLGSKYNISPSSCNHTFVLLCPLCSLQSLKIIE